MKGVWGARTGQDRARVCVGLKDRSGARVYLRVQVVGWTWEVKDAESIPPSGPELDFLLLLNLPNSRGGSLCPLSSTPSRTHSRGHGPPPHQQPAYRLHPGSLKPSPILLPQTRNLTSSPVLTAVLLCPQRAWFCDCRPLPRMCLLFLAQPRAAHSHQALGSA